MPIEEEETVKCDVCGRPGANYLDDTIMLCEDADKCIARAEELKEKD